MREIILPEKLDILARIGNFDNVDTFIESVSKDILIDTSDLEYSRPDKYHVDLTYSKLLRGENCERSELSALYLWVLSSSLMKCRSSVFLTSDNIDVVSSIVEYLYQRKLIVPIYLCVKKSRSEKRRSGCRDLPFSKRKKYLLGDT